MSGSSGGGAAAPPVLVKGRWLILGLMVATTTLNFIDRQLPFVLIEKIRRDLDLSDTQIGLMGGIAFSLVYSLAAIPLARLADLWSRKWVLAGCIAFWSALTACGGLAQNFLQLALTRTGVAVAEAGANPCAHSLLAQLFPDRRGLALAINAAGIPAGMMLGMALGGWLVDHMDWRTVMMLAGIPGAVLALAIVFSMREPPRESGHAEKPPFWPTVRLLMGRRSFPWMTAGATLCCLASSGGSSFAPAFLMREHGFSASQAGLACGLIFGICGLSGTLSAGVVGDRLARKTPARRLTLVMIATLAMAPLYCLAWMAPSAMGCILALAPAWFLLSIFLPTTYAATQAIAPPLARATTSALFALSANLGGTAIGPILTGALSDGLKPLAGEHSLGWALALTGLIAVPAALCYGVAARTHAADVAMTEAAG